MKCCVRALRGGGAGNRLPYRWHVESGVVLMCVLALAPAAPIIAPFSVMYFIICNPVLRYIMIFTYRPYYDAGGIRWPFLFDMCISSLIVGQIILGTMMGLKKAAGPAAMATVMVFPTLIFRRTIRKRFLKAYEDASLLQTSLLDGWDTCEKSDTSTMEGREEFRRFLVDAHKAAYVPVCITGTNTDKVITAEPAVVVPAPTDVDMYSSVPVTIPAVVPHDMMKIGDAPSSVVVPSVVESVISPAESETPISDHTGASRKHANFFVKARGQVGAVMRRGPAAFSPQQTSPAFRMPATPSIVQTVSEAGSQSKHDPTEIRFSSLGKIKQGPDGETEYFFPSETDKEK
jgi:hypothetical protein